MSGVRCQDDTIITITIIVIEVWCAERKNRLEKHLLGMIKLVEKTTLSTSLCNAILIALTMSASSRIAERSLSRLRSVRAALESALFSQHESYLCKLLVHHVKVNHRQAMLRSKFIYKGGNNLQWLSFLLPQTQLNVKCLEVLDLCFLISVRFSTVMIRLSRKWAGK